MCHMHAWPAYMLHGHWQVLSPASFPSAVRLLSSMSESGLRTGSSSAPMAAVPALQDAINHFGRHTNGVVQQGKLYLTPLPLT